VSSVAVLALDLHKKFSRAVTMDHGGGVLDDRRVSHADHAEMEGFFREFELGTDVVMEATFNWPWVVDLAEKCGLRPHIGDPMRIKDFRKGLPKSDRKDAIGQGNLWLRRMFPEAYIAPRDVRRRRGLFRMRSLFVRMRTALKNNIHGQLFKLGLNVDETSDAFGDAGRWAMTRLPLDDDSRLELSRKLALLDDLALHIARIERQIRDEVRESDDARLLDTLPGFAEITAHGFLAEIGEVGRFPNSRALAAYGGTLPLDNESADKDLGKRTGAHSNRFLRWIVLEAVNGAVRKSPRMRSLYTRVKRRNRKQPGKARVAVARELMELAYLVLTRRVAYMESPPPRPGSEKGETKTKRPRKSFPLTGRRLGQRTAERPATAPAEG
jgi:transposase